MELSITLRLHKAVVQSNVNIVHLCVQHSINYVLLFFSHALSIHMMQTFIPRNVHLSIHNVLFLAAYNYNCLIYVYIANVVDTILL